GAAVLVREHRHRPRPELIGGPEGPHGDLCTVGDQNFREHCSPSAGTAARRAEGTATSEPPAGPSRGVVCSASRVPLTCGDALLRGSARQTCDRPHSRAVAARSSERFDSAVKRSTPTLIICAAVLAAVAACTPTGSEEPASPESTSSAPADSEPSEDAAGESADEPSESPEAGDSDSDSDSDSEESTGSENEPGGSADRPEDSSVTVTLGGDTTVVEPTDVYC